MRQFLRLAGPFGPVRKAIDDAELMDEALVEHAGAKDLISQLEDATPEDDFVCR
jgi:hypothetical protein